MNPGLGSDLAKEFRRPEYRLMLVADKFQTGFDQPLLCAMYVDKRLPDVHAVQTLSRLNRTYRAPSGEVKDRTFVLDFVNDPEEIREAFLAYYLEAHVETTTDPNLVHRLATKLAQARIYTSSDVQRYAEAWWAHSQSHAALAAAVTPPRDEFVSRWTDATERQDGQGLDELRTFRKDCGSYVRLYDFMSQVVDYGTSDLEKLAEFLRQLTRLLPGDETGFRRRRLRAGTAPGPPNRPRQGRHRVVWRPGHPGTRRHHRESVRASHGRTRSRSFFRRSSLGSTPSSAPSSRTRRSRVSLSRRQAWPRRTRASPIRSTTTPLDQFMASPELRETLTDAAVLNEGAFGKLTGALTGESERADEFIRLIGAYLYQSRRLRTVDAEDPDDADRLGRDR